MNIFTVNKNIIPKIFIKKPILGMVYKKFQTLFFLFTFIILFLIVNLISEANIVKGTNWIVASRSPVATEAGTSMLQQGGNAFDAVVAGLAALGVVDTLMSGLGAEVFALVYSAEEKKVISINGVLEPVADNMTIPARSSSYESILIKFISATGATPSIRVP